MSKEIKEKIDEYNRQIESLLDPTQFTLNKKVEKIQKEIEKLQANCQHEYVHGVCKYCYKEEK